MYDQLLVQYCSTTWKLSCVPQIQRGACLITEKVIAADNSSGPSINWCENFVRDSGIT